MRARNLPGRSRRPPPRRRRHGERPGPWPGAPRSGLAELAFAPGGPPGQSPRHSAPRRTSATVAATPLATTEAAAPWAPTRSGRLHNDSYLAECSSSWRVDIEGTQSSVPCHHSLTGGCLETIPKLFRGNNLGLTLGRRGKGRAGVGKLLRYREHAQDRAWDGGWGRGGWQGGRDARLCPSMDSVLRQVQHERNEHGLSMSGGEHEEDASDLLSRGVGILRRMKNTAPSASLRLRSG